MQEKTRGKWKHQGNKAQLKVIKTVTKEVNLTEKHKRQMTNHVIMRMKTTRDDWGGKKNQNT